MRYAKVENGVVVSVYASNPEWMHDGGVFLTDEEYVRDHQVYPVKDNVDAGSIYFDRPFDQWGVVGEMVVPIYYTLRNTTPVSTLGTSFSRNGVSEWVIDGDFIEPTYTETVRTSQEIDIIANSIGVGLSDDDTKTPRLKSEWYYSGMTITPTYYNIISDPERDNHPEELYTIERSDIGEWNVNGGDIQEVCVFTPKTNIDDIISELNEKSANMRYEIEISGMFFNIGENTVIIDSDRGSQSRVTAKYLYYTTNTVNGGDIITWKTSNGRVRMSIDQFKEMSLKMFGLVDGLYNAETSLNTIIESSETFTELEHVLSAFLDTYRNVDGVNITDNMGG